jgi:hypothetical protein
LLALAKELEAVGELDPTEAEETMESAVHSIKRPAKGD